MGRLEGAKDPLEGCKDRLEGCKGRFEGVKDRLEGCKERFKTFRDDLVGEASATKRFLVWERCLFLEFLPSIKSDIKSSGPILKASRKDPPFILQSC